MKPDVVVVRPLMPEIEGLMVEAFTLHRLWEAQDKSRFLTGIAQCVRGLSTTGGAGAGRDLIEALPKLEIISIYGVGYDAVDLPATRNRGILVTNTPDVLTDDVADMGVGLMIAAMRRIALGDRFVRTGRWPKDNMGLATRIGGKRLGILGLGRIGMAVAKRAEAFGMEIHYCNRSPRKDVPYRYHPNVLALAEGCDVMMLCATGGPETKGLVNRAVLDALGPEGMLVNIARGSVVDEPELVAALAEGRLGGAGLDVFADEPTVPEALWHMDNVVLQPHQASATVETRLAMGKLMFENLRRHFAQESVLTPVA